MENKDHKALKEIYKIYKAQGITNFKQPYGVLERQLHIDMLKYYLTPHTLPRHYQKLESGQPWLLFWATTALAVLDSTFIPPNYFINYLQEMQYGAFQGSSYQLTNISSTYAAIGCIVNIGTEEAYKLIDVKAIKSFLLDMKKTKLNHATDFLHWNLAPQNAFQMHLNGEFDLRAMYFAVAAADILGFAKDPDFMEGIGDAVASCQTYEGGLSCIQSAEAHAGYSFCGIATLAILGEMDKINQEALLEWAMNRQTEEGGFNGRINKLVDACYNFWVGGIGKILGVEMSNYNALATYTLCCCQHNKGGFVDKPPMASDLYHCCYVASGLAYCIDQLNEMDPLYNMPKDKVIKAKKYFANLKQKENI